MRCMCMTLVGVIGFVAYTAYCAMDPVVAPVATRQIDEQFAIAPRPSTSASPKAASPVNAGDAQSTQAQTIGEGSTREQVVALWGTPTAIDMTNDRWTYGQTMVVFRNDRVAGMLTLTDKQLSILKEDKSAAKGAARTNDRTGTKRMAARTNTTCRRGAPAAYPLTQSLPGGFAPVGQSAARTGQSFWEPMYRPFYSDQPLPRGQSHLAPHWLGIPTYSQSYFQRPYRR